MEASKPRSRKLFVTTLTELIAIAALAMIGLSRMPNARVQHARRERNPDAVVDEGPEQVLAHRPHGRARELEGLHRRAQVTAHERDVAGLDRDVAPRADRDAHVGLRERRRVVDAVADHRDDAALTLQPANLVALPFRQHARDDAVDAGAARDRRPRCAAGRR